MQITHASWRALSILPLAQSTMDTGMSDAESSRLNDRLQHA